MLPWFSFWFLLYTFTFGNSIEMVLTDKYLEGNESLIFYEYEFIRRKTILPSYKQARLCSL